MSWQFNAGYAILNKYHYKEATIMAITFAQQKGSLVYAYDGSHVLWNRAGQLLGFTSATVSIKTSPSTICECDQNNHIVTTHQA